MIDPDNGVNLQRKLSAAEEPNSLHQRLLESVPEADDPQWISKLYDLPKINFDTMFDYLVECQVLLKRVSPLEGIVDKRATKAENGECTMNEKLKVASDVTDDDDGEYVQISSILEL